MTSREREFKNERSQLRCSAGLASMLEPRFNRSVVDQRPDSAGPLPYCLVQVASFTLQSIGDGLFGGSAKVPKDEGCKQFHVALAHDLEDGGIC